MRKFFITEDQINYQFSEWNKTAGSYQQMKMLETIVLMQEIKDLGVMQENKELEKEEK